MLIPRLFSAQHDAVPATGAMQIREHVVEVIDNGSYEIKRQFIQACVQQIKIAGNSVTICFSVRELPASSTHIVAGVVLRYCATQPMTFEMPDSVYANKTLAGV